MVTKLSLLLKAHAYHAFLFTTPLVNIVLKYMSVKLYNAWWIVLMAIGTNTIVASEALLVKTSFKVMMTTPLAFI